MHLPHTELMLETTENALTTLEALNFTVCHLYCIARLHVILCKNRAAGE